MDNKMNMEKSEIGFLDLPQELREMILEKCEQQNLAKMALSAPNLSFWLTAKFVTSLKLFGYSTDALMECELKYGPKENDIWPNYDVKIQGVFTPIMKRGHNENGANTHVRWEIDHRIGRTSRTEYFIEKNYEDAAHFEFQKFLDFSRNYVKNIFICWKTLDQKKIENYQTIHPKKFKNLRVFRFVGLENNEQNIGYDFEDVLNWKMAKVQIYTNHWKIEDYRRFITNWLGKTEEEELDIGSRTFNMTPEKHNKLKLEKRMLFHGLVYRIWSYDDILSRPHRQYHFTHPIFPDNFLSVKISDGHLIFAAKKLSNQRGRGKYIRR